jgi:hypothetical protein
MRRNEEAGGVRKKIEDYSFLLSQNIGKGYSSIVYQGRNDATGTFRLTQMKQSPSK